MSLMDEIKTIGAKAAPVCAVAVIVDKLEGQDRADLETALADGTIPGTAIATALSRRGFQIKPPGLQRHRRGGCSCGS